MVKSKVRRWCESIAKEFNCSLSHTGKEWIVIQKGKSPKIVYRSNYLIDIQNFFLKEIHKYIGKKMKIVTPDGKVHSLR
jgi:hypothetical protein